MQESGWEIVCPDEKVRHPPYHNEDDARCDAIVLDRRGCRDPEADSVCPGGTHTVRQCLFTTPGLA